MRWRMRPSRVSASGQIEWTELSPKGERALIVARGDVFTVPIEKGATRNLTNSSNAHERFAVWSPDGATIAFISTWMAKTSSTASARTGWARRRTDAWIPCDALSAELVAGRKADCVQRQGRQAIRADARGQEGDADCAESFRADRFVSVVVGWKLSGLCHDRSERIFVRVYMERRGWKSASRH